MIWRRNVNSLPSYGGEEYTPIIADEYRWEVWAIPKKEDGTFDHNNALTGDDLLGFVNVELFPYLAKFKQVTDDPDTIEYKIGEIFSELKNRLQSGYNLREVIERIDELSFQSSAEKHEMSHLYEDKIKNMGNAGRNGGEYYTPRPLIRAIVQVVAPQLKETVYDGAVGSAGFLVEAFDYLCDPKHSGKKSLSIKDRQQLQKQTFYGKEKKSLAYIIGTMNMILHGVEAPNILHTNTLAENISDIHEKDRYQVVLANPPFGGKERAEVQQNFPIKTGETAFLFLQHFIKIMKAGGRAGVVIKNTFLSNSDNASVSLRKELLESSNLHTVLDLPGGTFTGAGVKTVVLFFDIEKLYGSLPDFFTSEEDLRKIWSDPATRKALLDKLDEVGFGLSDLNTLKELIQADKSDLFDVLEYVAYAIQPVTRQERVTSAYERIFDNLDQEQREFIEFVLQRYIETGVEVLDQSLLPELLELKYHALADAQTKLGDLKQIRQLFIEFQKHLYDQLAV